VLMLALELPETVAVLDDALARRVAHTLNLKLTGTLGILIVLNEWV
jgi:predicted nucleic acid-binding protein